MRVPEWFQPYDRDGLDPESYRRNLPHRRQQGATYFVTFRLNDSLPKTVVATLRTERESWLRRMEAERRDGRLSVATRKAWSEMQRRHFRKVEAIMDAGHGACLLRAPAIRAIVGEALHHFEGVRCRMAAFVVMPNHVHALFQPLGEWTVEQLTGSWKCFSAGAINGRVGRTGQLWQRESFDRIVRDEAEFQRTVDYIVRNPAKLRAGDAEVWVCEP